MGHLSIFIILHLLYKVESYASALGSHTPLPCSQRAKLIHVQRCHITKAMQRCHMYHLGYYRILLPEDRQYYYLTTYNNKSIHL